MMVVHYCSLERPANEGCRAHQHRQRERKHVEREESERTNERTNERTGAIPSHPYQTIPRETARDQCSAVRCSANMEWVRAILEGGGGGVACFTSRQSVEGHDAPDADERHLMDSEDRDRGRLTTAGLAYGKVSGTSDRVFLLARRRHKRSDPTFSLEVKKRHWATSCSDEHEKPGILEDWHQKPCVARWGKFAIINMFIFHNELAHSFGHTTMLFLLCSLFWFALVWWSCSSCWRV